ncbi:hypothetical protein V1264_008090 [Littorina saxatilis]|uniref:Uncharacterized protein n=1 Tax=Littorina saxatilis TaxID=31220 RepID=A0AAN9ASI7_9CAEN
MDKRTQKETTTIYSILSRLEQVVLMRLRTGQNRLNALMSRKFKQAPSPTCTYDGLEDKTADHILQSCPLLQKERQEVWPSPTPLQTKLHGSRLELEKTTTFISRAGLNV